MKRLNLNQKYALISFRLVISMLLIFFAVYARTSQVDLLIGKNLIYWILGLAGIQTMSNLIVAFVPDRFIRKGLGVGFFLFDLAAVSMAVYWTQGFESDLFLIYFLVIFMTAIAREPAISFAVAALACLLYGFMFLKTHQPAEIFQSSILIRFPLLWVTAFFSSVLVHDLETERASLMRQTAVRWARSEKLAAVGQMAKAIAQELNNPLTSILGISQMILSQKNMQEEDLSIIERNAERCKKILEEFVSFAGESAVEFEDLDVRKPLADVLLLLKDQLKHSKIEIQWQTRDTADHFYVSGSLAHLRQVLFNLAMNAIQAMPDGGILTIEINKKSAMSARHIPLDFVEVSLRDTGRGISKEILDRIFEPPFHCGSEGSPGFGIAVAKSLVEKHNGKIGIESLGEGRGARAYVHLPLRALAKGASDHVLEKLAV